MANAQMPTHPLHPGALTLIETGGGTKSKGHLVLSKVLKQEKNGNAYETYKPRNPKLYVLQGRRRKP